MKANVKEICVKGIILNKNIQHAVEALFIDYGNMNFATMFTEWAI